MGYTIIEKDENIFKITFYFVKSIAVVTITKVGFNKIHLFIKNEEYRDFEFWLAQEPGAYRMFGKNSPKDVITVKVKKLWASKNFMFQPEDKNSFYLRYGYGREFGFALINIIAKVIEPRFAQRERLMLYSQEEKVA